MDVGPADQAPGGQRLDQELAGGPHEARGGQDEGLAGHRVRHQGLAGRAQGGQVGHQVLVDGGRDADQDGVGLAQPGRVVGDLEPVVTAEPV